MNIPHPYEAQNTGAAYPENGQFFIRGKTYGLRNKLRDFCRWNPEKRCWVCTTEHEEKLKSLGILIMSRVRVEKHCHEEETVVWATHKEIAYGSMLLGCGWCDTLASCGDAVKILEVLPN